MPDPAPSDPAPTNANQPTIEDYYEEGRTFAPPAAFAAAALTHDRSLYEEAQADRLAFWARQAREHVTWFKDFDTVLSWDLPFAKWFVGGKLNVSYNCLDRHVEAGKGDKVAFWWEGEPGDTRTITYADLLDEVSRFANVLKKLGTKRGDRVCIYMPMIPELPVAMLACTRIGAAHSVVFGGFSADSLADRIADADAKLLITADGGYRRGDPFPLKPTADEAVAATDSIENVIVVKRTDTPTAWNAATDRWYHELMADPDITADCAPEHMDSEDLLYLLYTSGTTAKPKGIMHTTGGYLTQVAFTHRYVFDLQPDKDVYWCAADIGWVTGHSYIVYGPLANGASSVIYEGTPDTPRPQFRTAPADNGSSTDPTDPATTDPAASTDRSSWPKDRLWDIIARYGVTQLYTAPTAIRTFMKWGVAEVQRHDLSSLRVLGTVGEPINPEAWMWYHTHIGGERCPIVDTWWQTETGGHMITPLPGVTTTKPGSATHALPGVEVELVDDAGKPVTQGGGYLTITEPWPAMLRGIWGDPERYKQTYWSTYPGRYFAGDGAKIDTDGYLWLLGRVDDVMNVSGHRISTTEVESALVDHAAVAEAAVVGAADDTTGQAIVGYVILRSGSDAPSGQVASGQPGSEQAAAELAEEIRNHVAQKLGAIARPKAVVLVPDLPKTRSGKIMRRLLQDVAEGRDLGDTTTLADSAVVEEIRTSAAAALGH